MINIKIKGIYTLDEALEVLNILQEEETTDGVGFRLEDGQSEIVEFGGIYNDYIINYVKKDLTINMKVEKLEDIKKWKN